MRWATSFDRPEQRYKRVPLPSAPHRRRAQKEAIVSDIDVRGSTGARELLEMGQSAKEKSKIGETGTQGCMPEASVSGYD